MREFHFLSTWLLACPREPIFDALWESETWPEWWPGLVEATETDAGDPSTGVGRRGRYEWRSRIPYPVRFEVVATQIERPSLLAGEASGDLTGVGRWRLFEADGISAVLYEWDVRATKRWINVSAPLLAPILRRNHDYLMRRGAEGLASRLGVELLACG